MSGNTCFVFQVYIPEEGIGYQCAVDVVGVELLCVCTDDVGSLCVVKDCVELEMFECVVVEKLLQGKGTKKVISQKGCSMSIQKCKDKASLIAKVA